MFLSGLYFEKQTHCIAHFVVHHVYISRFVLPHSTAVTKLVFLDVLPDSTVNKLLRAILGIGRV